tara:strand:+ start:427 stop:558 length:132 start_codon:yes stop_codon:yes gene_type:complete
VDYSNNINKIGGAGKKVAVYHGGRGPGGRGATLYYKIYNTLKM